MNPLFSAVFLVLPLIGNTQVGNDETLESGLINNLDLLALFGSGGIVELEYEPAGIFDRVEIGAESIASVNVTAEPLRLYSVERYGDTCPLTNTPFPFEVPSCSSILIESHNADDVQNLFDDDFDSYATLKSGAGILFGLGNKYEGYVEMGYEQAMPAGTTSYIRIDFEETILEGLVGGSLGNVVSGLLDGLVLGDHFFRVDVKDANANIIHTASSNQASAGGDGTIRVVQDAAGRYYIAVTPTQDYKSVRITDATNSALGLLAQPNTMNVYGMCTDFVESPCFGAFATSYEHEGLSLSVNDLGGAGVTNMSYAINGNTTNYSEISNGTLGVGASTKQWIFFNSVSNEQDMATIRFKTEGGVVDADILGGLEIKAYLGNDEVYSVSSQNGLINGVNVAQLLSNNQMVNLDISPGQNFDRISVGIKTLAGVAVFPPIHLYGVDRICVTTILSAKDDTIKTSQDTPVDGNVLTNDEGDNLTVTALTYYDEHGSLQTVQLNNTPATVTVYTEGPNPVKAGEITIDPDGSYTFTPETGFIGNVPLHYTVTDGDENTDEANIYIEVLPENRAPVANDDYATVPVDGTVTIDVLENDNDDADGALGGLDTSSLNIISGPLNGLAVSDNVNGTITYTPDIGYIGMDTLIYQICDIGSPVLCDTAMVVIKVGIPDLTPNITLVPSVITGPSSFDILIEIFEEDNIPTDGSEIVVVIPKDATLPFSYDPNATQLGFFSVDNILWAYDSSNPFYHIFTSNQIIPAGGVSAFAISTSYDPMGSIGEKPISATIFSGGGEENIANNGDADMLIFFAE